MTVHSMKAMQGQTVVALDTAEEIGEVKHFVVSRDAQRIERLHVDGRKKNAVFTEWADLESFGGDRVMVRAASATDGSDDDRDLDAAKGDIELIGSRLLDTDGFEHGKVDDARFDSDDGRILSVSSSDGEEIDAEKLRSIGSYAVVFTA